MKLHDLRPDPGAKKKRKRVGRGTGSGRGKTAGRGTKGQNARSGGGVRPGFEGGQLPLIKRLPKLKGFKNPFKVHYVPVNLDRLSERFEAGDEVTPESLHAKGLLGEPDSPVVILARGDLDKPLHVKAHRVSGSARQKIEAAGGTVEILPLPAQQPQPQA